MTKKLFALFWAVVFVASFGLGYLAFAKTAEAACPNSCATLRCPLNAVCQCDTQGNRTCCRCIRFVD